MNNQVAIAIDGPAAAGKSTVAKRIAKKLSYIYIDTGAMYRSLTYTALRQGARLDSEEALVNLLHRLSITFEYDGDQQHVFVNGEDITKEIRTQEVSSNVSTVATHLKVREILVQRQKQLSKETSVVMDGRDIGTHVLPDAQFKFFLIASVEERAKRRHEENIKSGFSSDLEKIKHEIERRDKQDMEREVSPLIKAEDAIEVDTTSMSIEEVTNFILNKVGQ
ncbi:MAG TPA: (d)CMP kinase [Bacillota bacterium]|nr:(d)CMP kinase [Bacillota bacterium]